MDWIWGVTGKGCSWTETPGDVAVTVLDPTPRTAAKLPLKALDTLKPIPLPAGSRYQYWM
jgi:hypothetical protein